MKDVYLLKGQELIYDVIKQQSTVRSFISIKNKNQTVEKAMAENPVIPRYDNKSWFMFNNQSLTEVLQALEDMYDVKIQYSKEQMNRMYFIGTFDKSDSIEYILNQIASLNKLRLTKNKNTYTLSKPTIKRKNKQKTFPN